jgi:hypothetical protein
VECHPKNLYQIFDGPLLRFSARCCLSGAMPIRNVRMQRVSVLPNYLFAVDQIVKYEPFNIIDRRKILATNRVIKLHKSSSRGEMNILDVIKNPLALDYSCKNRIQNMFR